MRDNDGESEFRKHNSGIGQGCPLSPYLFLYVATVMFSDIHSIVGRKRIGGKIDGLLFTEIQYADDTLTVLTKDEGNKYHPKINTG